MQRIFAHWLPGAVLLFFCTAALAQKQWDGWDYTFDREITPWSEMQAQLPAYPSEENLIPLNVNAITTHRYFVDSKSVSTGTWVRARNPQWRPVEFKETLAHHNTLYREYFCDGKFMIDSAEKIVSALRAGPKP